MNKTGGIVESRVDLLDLKRLMPGEASSFMTVTHARPEMSTFRVHFESQVGTPLSQSP
jgi:hypothetical protein